MCSMNFDGHVEISRTSISDQTNTIACRFFFTCDMVKSRRFISDETDLT